MEVVNGGSAELGQDGDKIVNGDNDVLGIDEDEDKIVNSIDDRFEESPTTNGDDGDTVEIESSPRSE